MHAMHVPDRYVIALLVISLGALGFLSYQLYVISQAYEDAERIVAETRQNAADFAATTSARINELESLLSETQTLLQEAVDESKDLERDLRREKNRNEEFEEQIAKIGATVGTLDKLAKTDKELLQKYSKVYFLNEHYMPERLVEIDKKYLYSESQPKFIHAQVAPFLEDMLDAALEDGVKIWVVSAFRSFDEQTSLKGQYSVTYGSGANTFSADQGYSEHQLGTTLDFTTEGQNGGLDGFDRTNAYAWLTKNAYRYGFVLSYPPNNAYYIFEPWHWRFVGVDLARFLHGEDGYFYDLDQRTIDTYLISIFD
jgi:LAS superfamily LD-carboxypeptidase LdcB